MPERRRKPPKLTHLSVKANSLKQLILFHSIYIIIQIQLKYRLTVGVSFKYKRCQKNTSVDYLIQEIWEGNISFCNLTELEKQQQQQLTHIVVLHCPALQYYTFLPQYFPFQIKMLLPTDIHKKLNWALHSEKSFLTLSQLKIKIISPTHFILVFHTCTQA